MSKRIISLLLSLVLVLGTVGVPAGASAATTPTLTIELTLNANGGAFSSKPFNEHFITLNDVNNTTTYDFSSHTVSRTGYQFNGWFTSASGGSEAKDGYTLLKKENHTLYAQWQKYKYTYTLDAKGGYFGSNTSTTTTTATLEFGDSFSKLQKPKRDGYTFAGWKVDGTTITDTDTASDSYANKTFTAEWTVNQYTITLNANGGTLTKSGTQVGGTASETVDYDTPLSSITSMYQPTRDNHTFKYWSTSSTGTAIANDAKVTGNQTLFAVWEGKPTTVSFNLNLPTGHSFGTGSTPSYTDITLTYGSKITTLPTPSPLPQYSDTDKTKYGFAGWYTLKEDDEFDPVDPDKELARGELVANNDTYTGDYSELHARWKYKVTFDPQGGTVTPTEKEVTTGTAMGTLPTPSRAGYDFGGWFTAETNGTKVTADTIANSQNKTLYAKWDNKAYNVTLDPNGGEFADDKKTDEIQVTYEGKYTDLDSKKPTRAGYKFLGWFTAEKDGTEVTSNTTVTETGPHTLYAHWNPNAVTITIAYHLPAGFDDTKNNYPQLTSSNNKIYIDQTFDVTGLPANPPSFTHEGVTYTFADWYTTEKDSVEAQGKQVNRATTLTADMVESGNTLTLHARWRFSVGFYENPNSTSPTKSVTCITGSAYGTRLYTPTRTGYTFMGWYRSQVKDNETPSVPRVLDVDAASTQYLKLYAAWTTSTYVVTPDPNRGTFSDAQTIPWPFNHGDAYGKYVSEPEYIPSPPAGHTFDGWYTEKEGGTKITPTTKVTETCTIYAHWKADQYKLTLKLGYSGASDIVKSVDYDTELSKALPSPEPERTGYAFDGWFEDEGFTKAANTKLKIRENITLYAKWTKAEKVDLNLGGGKLDSGVPSYIYVYEDGTYEKLPEPTWPGNVFVGWYTTETGSTKIERSTKVTKPIPQTLYARWTPLEVTVTLNYNGAPNETIQQKYKVGDKYSRLPTYARWNAYEFMGWYTQAAGGEKVDRSTEVTVASSDKLEVTLYAHWGYTVAFEPGDGMGDMESQVAEMNQPYTLPECTFTPPDGMRFGGWAIGTPDGPKQASGSQYTVIRNLTLYATWTDKPITVKATCTSGGSLMTTDGKSNTVTAERGSDVTFIARANTGYELRDLQVDGVSFNFTEEYTFRNISEDHEIHAVFAPIGAPAYSTCDHGTSCPLSGYRDLNPNAWYHDAVHFCMDNVIMGGSGNTFSPNARASRADVATSMWSAEDRPSPLGYGPLPNTYSDVKVSDWYYQPIEWATKQGILAGYGNGKFGPNDFITREQMVSILWRHAGQPKPRQTVLRFKDASRVSDYAWEAMCWATEQKIVQGRPDGSLAPKGTATRADVAQMLKNYLG